VHIGHFRQIYKTSIFKSEPAITGEPVLIYTDYEVPGLRAKHAGGSPEFAEQRQAATNVGPLRS
jgi:hypothetical protein